MEVKKFFYVPSIVHEYATKLLIKILFCKCPKSFYIYHLTEIFKSNDIFKKEIKSEDIFIIFNKILLISKMKYSSMNFIVMEII